MTKRVTKESLAPRAPVKMPRPSEKEIGKPPELEPKSAGFLSPLGIYLKANKISKTAFSRALGIAHKTTLELCSGKTMPSLVMAFEIERVTKGVVPAEVWLGLPEAKAKLAKMRQKQPEGVRNQPRVLEAGGFASPQEKAKTGPKPKLKTFHQDNEGVEIREDD